jgi:hypothetical protein
MNRATETGCSLTPSNRASIPVLVQLQPSISPESRLIFMRPDLTAILGRVRRDYWTAPSPGVLSRNLSVSHSPLGIQKPLPPFSRDQGTLLVNFPRSARWAGVPLLRALCMGVWEKGLISPWTFQMHT